MTWSKHFWPAIIWLTTLTFASVAKAPRLPDFNLFTADKIIHFGIYGLLVMLLLGGVRFAGGVLTVRMSLIAVAFAAFWGILMECVQGMLPHRRFELDDMIANAIGACMAPGVYWLFRKLGFR